MIDYHGWFNFLEVLFYIIFQPHSSRTCTKPRRTQSVAQGWFAVPTGLLKCRSLTTLIMRFQFSLNIFQPVQIELMHLKHIFQNPSDAPEIFFSSKPKWCTWNIFFQHTFKIQVMHLKYFLSKSRWCTWHIFKIQVMHLTRGLACNSCCFPCCLQSIEVTHSPTSHFS